MFTNLVKVQGNEIILQRDQFAMLATLIVAVLIVLVVIYVAFKRRQKNFIKTVPTNLKDVD